MPDAMETEIPLTTNQKIDKLQETMDSILAIVSDVKAEVAPLLAKVESNAMFKMFLGGK